MKEEHVMGVDVHIHCEDCRAKTWIGREATLQKLDEAIGALVIGADEYEQRADLAAYIIAHSRGWRTDFRPVDPCRLAPLRFSGMVDICPDCFAKANAPRVDVDNSLEAAL